MAQCVPVREGEKKLWGHPYFQAGVLRFNSQKILLVSLCSSPALVSATLCSPVLTQRWVFIKYFLLRPLFLGGGGGWGCYGKPGASTKALFLNINVILMWVVTRHRCDTDPRSRFISFGLNPFHVGWTEGNSWPRGCHGLFNYIWDILIYLFNWFIFPMWLPANSNMPCS